ncbi:MAG TPA: XRE family transcriptional regulator [Aeromonadales bacterium]|nr:XRE family transcriptional regulator [Aeromonadales bacterium]
MKINNALVSRERIVRQWSQQQLADMTGLSLRTIQRIENSGNASYGSIKSIASVLEVSAKDFLAEKNNSWLSLKLALLSSLLASFLYFSLASAQPVMLDVAVNSAQENLASVQLLNETGEESEFRIDELLKVTFIAEMTRDKKLKIRVKAYELSSDGEKLLGTPVVITSNRKAAMIKFEGGKGMLYEIVITPDYKIQKSIIN